MTEEVVETTEPCDICRGEGGQHEDHCSRGRPLCGNCALPKKKRGMNDLFPTCECGRKLKLEQDDTLEKLEQAYSYGCSDPEAAEYAGVSLRTLQNYKHYRPWIVERIELWKTRAIIKARKAVVDGAQTDPYLALKFLERVRSDEFSTKIQTEGRAVLELQTIHRHVIDAEAHPVLIDKSYIELPDPEAI